MDKHDQYAVAKKYLAEIDQILKTERMTIDRREALQQQAARLSRAIPRLRLPPHIAGWYAYLRGRVSRLFRWGAAC
jgi:hypothetical protein